MDSLQPQNAMDNTPSTGNGVIVMCSGAIGVSYGYGNTGLYSIMQVTLVLQRSRWS